MIHIEKFEVNPIQENCYIVSDETKETVIVDAGAVFPEENNAIKSYIDNNDLRPVHLINTHGHLDHIFGTRFIYDTYGLKDELHINDADIYSHLDEQSFSFFRKHISNDVAPVGRYLEEGDLITFGTHTIKVILTPGHTPGGVVFYCEEENFLFSGDTLFFHSVGRTDLPGGSSEDLMNSLSKKILVLPSDTVIFPGHGPQTSVGEELKSNPYLFG